MYVRVCVCVRERERERERERVSEFSGILRVEVENHEINVIYTESIWKQTISELFFLSLVNGTILKT